MEGVEELQPGVVRDFGREDCSDDGADLDACSVVVPLVQVLADLVHQVRQVERRYAVAGSVHNGGKSAHGVVANHVGHHGPVGDHRRETASFPTLRNCNKSCAIHYFATIVSTRVDGRQKNGLEISARQVLFFHRFSGICWCFYRFQMTLYVH